MPSFNHHYVTNMIAQCGMRNEESWYHIHMSKIQNKASEIAYDYWLNDFKPRA